MHGAIGNVWYMNARDVEKALLLHCTSDRAASYARFFKTGKGEYGEGDRFIGVTVPNIRAVARRFCALPRPEITRLLESPIHEHRLAGLLILVTQYERSEQRARQSIAAYYRAHLDHVNNWDLVDLSAHKILGAYARDHGRVSELYRLAKSRTLWRRRVAIVSTFAYLADGTVEPSLAVATLLLHDTHDLIHKATGWVLREVGKRDPEALRGFLRANVHEMPRTMLRYSIERLPERERRRWLSLTPATRHSHRTSVGAQHTPC
jgi:3-methyladenine DNA glycosylase AlkD